MEDTFPHKRHLACKLSVKTLWNVIFEGLGSSLGYPFGGFLGSDLCLGVPETRNLINGGGSAFEVFFPWFLMLFWIGLGHQKTLISREWGITNHVFS